MYGVLLADLGFRAVVRPDESGSVLVIEEGEYRFEVHKPYKSQVTAADRDFAEGHPLVEVTHRLAAADPQPTPVKLDGEPATLADALRVDIFGPLTREPGEGEVGADGVPVEEPAIGMAFAAAERAFQLMRVLAQAPSIRPLSPADCVWILYYVEDDGTPVDPAPPLIRRRLKGRFTVPSMPLIRDAALWSAVIDVPDDYEIPPWETLLLDARNLLPEIGPALVLATSAIEARTDDALEQLARSKGENVAALWSWISQRDQYWRRPAFAERLSDMLLALGARSVKEDAALWEGFQNLRNARNDYVHRGVALLGGQPVTLDKANQLIQNARLTIDWIEEQLPATRRRPRFEGKHVLQTSLLITPQETPGQTTGEP
jgi:hypothetical protein